MLLGCFQGPSTCPDTTPYSPWTPFAMLHVPQPDLSDLHPAKAARGSPLAGARIGDHSRMGRILVRGEPGNGVIDELAPAEVKSHPKTQAI